MDLQKEKQNILDDTEDQICNGYSIQAITTYIASIDVDNGAVRKILQ